MRLAEKLFTPKINSLLSTEIQLDKARSLIEVIMNFLPQLAQHTSWEREIWPPQWFLDSIFLPPAQPHVVSSATSEEHHHPLSSHPVDARAELAFCSPVLVAAYEYPALIGHAHCAQGYATGKRRQHLRDNEKALGFFFTNISIGRSSQ